MLKYCYCHLISSTISLLVQAIENFKASAAAQNRPKGARSESSKELPKLKPESSRVLNEETEPSFTLPTHQSSALPADFFDNHETKKQKVGRYLLIQYAVSYVFSFSVKLLVG